VLAVGDGITVDSELLELGSRLGLHRAGRRLNLHRA
jgi:hypothetical protein